MREKTCAIQYFSITSYIFLFLMDSCFFSQNDIISYLLLSIYISCYLSVLSGSVVSSVNVASCGRSCTALILTAASIMMVALSLAAVNVSLAVHAVA